MSRKFEPSELILNERGAVYHLNLLPEEIAETIITVGDPQRVKKVSQYFDTIVVKRKKREFKTHTGTLNGKKISVISTGIGTDNIDIVMNEIDALFNINLKTRKEKKKHTQLKFIRIGTSGSLREDVKVESFVANSYGIGIDGLGIFYGENDERLNNEMDNALIPIYSAKADDSLLNSIGNRMIKGIAITAGGFYAPQGRSIRYRVNHDEYIQKLASLTIEDSKVTNMEMETAAIYMLANKLGHKALSCNAILANRITGEFSNVPGETVDRLIRQVLQELTH